MMNRGLWVFFGALLAVGSSLIGLVIAPYLQISRVRVFDRNSTEVYPKPLDEQAAAGQKVYIANGCIYCHSQQVRGPGYGADIARGWGPRRTVPRDYMYDAPIMLGTMRTGPDLANAGKRWSADWHHKHLYNPRMMSPGSTMPSFAFLYETRKIEGSPSPDALILSGPWAPEAGNEIVPTADAKALVAYLLALDRTFDLPEAHE